MLNVNLQKQLGELSLRAELSIPTQGITGIFGVSGSGKSSLINLISGLMKPDQGRIQLNGRTLVETEKKINLPPHRRNLGYVFQDARLFPHYSVKGNLLYGVKNSDEPHFEQIVALLGLEPLLRRYPLSLSGGEKQRVAIGRALLSKPEMLLMDEPLSALDLPRKQELLAYLEKLTQDIQVPILYVTHSLDELRRLAERVIFMENGNIAAYGELEPVLQSAVFEKWKQG